MKKKISTILISVTVAVGLLTVAAYLLLAWQNLRLETEVGRERFQFMMNIIQQGIKIAVTEIAVFVGVRYFFSDSARFMYKTACCSLLLWKGLEVLVVVWHWLIWAVFFDAHSSVWAIAVYQNVTRRSDVMQCIAILLAYGIVNFICAIRNKRKQAIQTEKTLHKGRKSIFRITALALVSVLLVTGLSGCVFLGSDEKSTDDISYYRALSGETDEKDMIPVFGSEFDMPCPYELPLLCELEPYADVHFNYTARRESFFQSHAYILIVSYEEDVFAEKKASLTEVFEAYSGEIPGETEAVPSAFELDGFEFYAVTGGEYPKEMLFVGTFNEEQKIAYIYFYDQDLDYVSPSVGKFLIQETGWKKVA